jgi:hypothetical protein
MRRARRIGLAFGVAAGGIALGTVLGAAANPRMKNLPEPAWPTVPDSGAVHAPEGVAVYELAPYPDRYAPPLPDEAITDWAPDYPAWTYSDFGDIGADLADGAASMAPDPPVEPRPLPPEPRLEGSLDALY